MNIHNLVIFIAVSGMLMAVPMSFGPQLQIKAAEKNTEQVAQALSRIWLDQYSQTGQMAESLGELQLDNAMSVQGTVSTMDAFGQSYEVQYFSGQGATYKDNPNVTVAVISAGANGHIDSYFDKSTGLLVNKGDDIVATVSSYELTQTARGVTKTKLERCNAAVRAYYTTNRVAPASLVDLIQGSMYMQPLYSYDEWGHQLVLTGTDIAAQTRSTIEKPMEPSKSSSVATEPEPNAAENLMRGTSFSTLPGPPDEQQISLQTQFTETLDQATPLPRCISVGPDSMIGTRDDVE